MALRVFRSLWGCEAQVPALRGAQCVADKLAILKGLGYDGVEASLPDIGATVAERNDFGHALREQEMGLILGLYSSWQDYEDWSDLHAPVATQAYSQTWLSILRLMPASGVPNALPTGGDSGAGAAGSIGTRQRTFRWPWGNTLSCTYLPFLIAGADSWSEQQSLEYFSEVTRHTEGPHGVTVSHESHRGRALANPFVAHRLCKQLPQLQLTLDASHWMVVCERLLGTGNEYEAQVDLAGDFHPDSVFAGASGTVRKGSSYALSDWLTTSTAACHDSRRAFATILFRGSIHTLSAVAGVCIHSGNI